MCVGVHLLYIVCTQIESNTDWDKKLYILPQKRQQFAWSNIHLLPVYKASYAFPNNIHSRTEPTQAIIIRKTQYGGWSRHRKTLSHTYPNPHTYNGMLRPAPVTVTWYPNPKLMMAVRWMDLNHPASANPSHLWHTLPFSLHLSAANECEKCSLLSPPSSSLQQAICQR